MPAVRCKCNRTLSYKPEFAGKVVKCPGCSARIQLPASASAAPSPTPPPAVGAVPSRPTTSAPPPAPPKPAPEPELTLEDDEIPSSAPAPAPTSGFALQPVQEYAVETPAAAAPPASVSASAPPVPTALPMGGDTFWDALPGAFRYPLGADAVTGLVICLFLFLLGSGAVWLVGSVPGIGLLVKVVVYGVLAAYYTGYAMSIIESSAEGQDSPPELPQIGNYQEAVMQPMVFVMAVGALTVGPYLLYVSWVPEEMKRAWIGWALLLPGLLYLPMALLSSSLDRSASGFNPVRGVRAIIRAWKPYLFIVGLVLFVGVMEVAGDWLRATLLKSVPVLPFVVQQALCFYLVFAAARLTGLLYHASGGKLKDLAGEV